MRETFHELCGQLEPLSPQQIAKELGPYAAVMETRDGLSPTHLRITRFEHMKPLLQQAVAKHWGILEVFTQQAFADGDGCALFLDRATLADIHKTFDLHGVWQIVARIAGEKDATLRMSYMIVGRGRLIIGYPQSATVTIDDGDAVTGDYDYAPYFSARIDGAPGEAGLYDIRSLASPEGKFESFIGPYGVKIRSLQLSGHDILIKYVWGIEQGRRARSVPISLRDRLAASR